MIDAIKLMVLVQYMLIVKLWDSLTTGYQCEIAPVGLVIYRGRGIFAVDARGDCFLSDKEVESGKIGDKDAYVWC